MMMDLSDILNNIADQDRGREFELADPVTGRSTSIKLWIVGPDSETAHRARLALVDELADMADHEGRVSAEQRNKARLHCLAAHVLRWEIEEDGRPVPFNTANLHRLLRIQWIEQQVDAFAGDRRNFRPED
mgnify:FL=1